MNTMDSIKAAALRKGWGTKPCAHPWWILETFHGSETGREVCVTCGQDRKKSPQQT